MPQGVERVVAPCCVRMRLISISVFSAGTLVVEFKSGIVVSARCRGGGCL